MKRPAITYLSPYWLAAVAIVALLLLLAISADACGKERWPVKTLGDPMAGMVKMTPVDATVASLTRLQVPDRKTLTAADAKRFAPEKQTYRVQALVVGYKLEADEDFHIVLADPKNPKLTIIAEMPAGACMATGWQQEMNGIRAKFVSDFSKPTAKFKRLPKAVPVTVVGVGFLDFIHGQTGVAVDGFELHPVLKLERN